MKVIWLASYPRSGNTWLRFLLYNYFWGEPAHSSQVALRIPDLHKVHQRQPALDLAQRENARQIFIKTHAPLVPEHPLLSYTGGFVYLIRHPRDVLLSLINYHGISGDEAVSFARQFIQTGVDPLFPIYGPWAAHVASWMGSKPKVVLRYDAMRAAPEAALASVLDFIGESYQPADLQRAVAACEFEQMRKAETREAQNASDKPSVFSMDRRRPGEGRHFVHQGVVGGTLASLAPDLDALFEKHFGPALRQWGLDQPVPGT